MAKIYYRRYKERIDSGALTAGQAVAPPKPAPGNAPKNDVWAGDHYLITATGADKNRLRALVEELRLPCAPYRG